MTPSGGAAPTCGTCGAPDAGEFVYCKFCRQAVSAEAQRTAVPCPSCRTACRWGKQKCGACQAWLVVSCVFCGSISPHNVPACLACHEPFAGAPQRKAAIEQQRQYQQNLEVAGVVGHVAAPFLGAALGAVVGSALSTDWSSDSSDGGDSGDSGGSSFIEEVFDAGTDSWDD